MEVMWDRLRAPNIFAGFEEGMEQGRQNKRQKVQDAYLDERIANERADRQRETDDRTRQTDARHRAAEAVGKGRYTEGIAAGIEAGDAQIVSAIKGLDDQERAKVKEHNQVMGAAMHALRDPKTGQPLPDAAQRWENMKRHFLQDGWDAESLNIDVMKPGVIDAEISDAMTLKDILQQTEQGRHNREMEDIGRERAESYDYGQRRPRAKGGGGGGLPPPPGGWRPSAPR